MQAAGRRWADCALGAGRTGRWTQVRAAGERQQACAQARGASGARGSRRGRDAWGVRQQAGQGRAGHATWARGLCAQAGPAGPVGCSCTRLGFQPGFFSTRYFS